jgi:hypothetical protein
LGTGTLSGGTATSTTSGLGTGAHSITAIYGGDANFTGSTSPILTETIGKAASSTAVGSSNNPSNIGTAVTFTATVTSPVTGTPTGTVTFQDGASVLGTGTLSGGTATFTTSGLTGGTHSITAVYSGDANFAGGTSPPLVQTVNKAASSTSVPASSNNPSIFGSAVTFTATVKPAAGSGTPTGTVTFNDGATVLGAGTLSGGTATLTTSGLGAGVHSITAIYAGDANFAISTSPGLTQTVADFALSASPTAAAATAGSTSTYAITITPQSGFSQTISFQCSGAPMLAVCTAPGSVSPTGGSYAPFNITVTTMAQSLVPPGTIVRWPWAGLRIGLTWLLALLACAILSRLAVPRRGYVWQVSSVAMFVLLLCGGCTGVAGSGSSSTPKAGTPPGTYTLTLTGTSGSLSHNTMLTLTVK